MGCGTGKLLPLVVNMKDPSANYFATDLSPKMIDLTMINLKQNLKMYESKFSLEQWLNKNRMMIAVANAEQPITKP